MAYKNTMAKNHLSNESMLASKGRYGDTEIRSVDGQPSHVNKVEANLIDMYGSQGESLTKALGTGDINPKTGMKEYPFPWLIAAAAATAVVGATSAYSGGRAKEVQAGHDIKSAEQGLVRLDQAEAGLEKGKGAKELVAGQDYEMESDKFSSEIGIGKEDINEQTSQAIQKSGLATTGTVQGKRSDMWDRVQGMFARGKKGLIANLGKSMGDIERWYEGEKARISSERQKFENQKSLAEDQKKGWYLGKHAGKLFR